MLHAVSGLRSERWFGGRDISGFIHRASIHAEGISRNALAGRPVVGICNSWSELVNCNLHFRGLAEAVKRGVLLAGGLPLEFPTISLGENLMKPTAMLFRNLMAMDVEECIRAYPLDAVVLLGGCDKTIPGAADGRGERRRPGDHDHRRPVAGGLVPRPPARRRHRPLALRRRAARGPDERGRVRRARGGGHRRASATATRWGPRRRWRRWSRRSACACPAPRRFPPSTPPASRAAEATGARAVELARGGLPPSRILTAEAFDNAITVLMAIGGGTNAVVHLLALAGRVGVPLTLERFHELSQRTPLLANVRPSGEHLVEELHRAGGIRAVMHELAPLLHGDAVTVTGAIDRRRIRRRRGARPRGDRRARRRRSRPRAASPSSAAASRPTAR